MDNDIKNLLKDYSKDNMPDLWDSIENKLYYKKKKRNKEMLAIAVSIAIIFTMSITYKNIFAKNSISKDNTIEYKIEVLEDLDLEKILKDKIVLGSTLENSYTDDSRFTNYEAEAEVIVYGKVVDVKSYVKFGGMIFSDIIIEVINDYKNNVSKEDTITLGVHGGELSYNDFIAQADSQLVDKRGYNNIEDKTKKFIETWEGIPVYRVGEYVLVYANAIANDEYYKENPDKSISYEYYPLKQLYVDPNTREIFGYKYESENRLIKNVIKSLDSLGDDKIE